MSRWRICAYRLYLLAVALLPLLTGASQCAHYICWLMDAEYAHRSVFLLFSVSSPVICVLVLVSLFERFCVWHRITLLGVAFINVVCFAADRMDALLYNILVATAVLGVAAGVAGSIIHFGFQINDFIRYIRVSGEKQDPHT